MKPGIRFAQDSLDAKCSLKLAQAQASKEQESKLYAVHAFPLKQKKGERGERQQANKRTREHEREEIVGLQTECNKLKREWKTGIE
jgi:hypothetical protein